jgi:dihydropteroate synthase
LTVTSIGRSEPAVAAAPSFAGLSLARPRIMGIVNVTPDSFSDGGEAFSAEAAVGRGLRLVDDGADIVDVGGESTRPGAAPVPLDEELRRVVPVVERLADAGVLVSIDTRRADVMTEAIAAGARIVNDVTGLTGDRRSLPLVAAGTASVVLMHMQGEPRTMQQAPRYADPAAEVRAWLSARIEACVAAGIGRERIAVDPGIGFGKTAGHNLEILNRLSILSPLCCAIVIGVSRKSFIARVSRNEPPKRRLAGSLAAALAAVARGAHVLRVHDVAETCQALAIWQAIDHPEELDGLKQDPGAATNPLGAGLGDAAAADHCLAATGLTRCDGGGAER